MNDEIANVLAYALRIEAGSITANSAQSNIPQWDSLAQLKLIVELEQRYEVRFRTDQVPELTSYARIARALEELGVR